MSVDDIDYKKAAQLENGDMYTYGSDADFAAEFHLAKVPNFEGTDYEEVVHLKLQAPGNTRTVYDQPARMTGTPDRPSDPERFPRAWADFQAGQTGGSGTSIFDWEGCTEADARRFVLNGIKTVEQLARVSDVNLANLGMGALALREKARRYLNGPGSIEADLMRQNAELGDQVSKLTEIVQGLLAKEEEKAAPKGKVKADG